MHIIFGQEQADVISQNHTVLELDTFRFMPQNVIQTAYTVVENIPIEDLSRLSFQKDLHHNLMENYRKGDWNFCEQAIEQLIGAFGGEVDSFYADLQTRIDNLKENDPGEFWDPIIEKTVVTESPES